MALVMTRKRPALDEPCAPDRKKHRAIVHLSDCAQQQTAALVEHVARLERTVHDLAAMVSLLHQEYEQRRHHVMSYVS